MLASRRLIEQKLTAQAGDLNFDLRQYRQVIAFCEDFPGVLQGGQQIQRLFQGERDEMGGSKGGVTC